MGEQELIEKINSIHIIVPGEDEKKVTVHIQNAEIIVFSINIRELGWLGVCRDNIISLSPAMATIDHVELLGDFSLKINGKVIKF